MERQQYKMQWTWSKGLQGNRSNMDQRTWTNNKRFSNGGCQTLHLLCCLSPGLSPTYPTFLVKIWRPEGFVLVFVLSNILTLRIQSCSVHRTGCSTPSFVRPFLDFKTKKPWGVMLGQSPNRLTKWRKRSQWSQQITSPTGWKERTPFFNCIHVDIRRDQSCISQ